MVNKDYHYDAMRYDTIESLAWTQLAHETKKNTCTQSVQYRLKIREVRLPFSVFSSYLRKQSCSSIWKSSFRSCSL